MAIHHLAPSRDTLRGSFSREFPPVLTIDSGDTVRFQTLDAGWTIDPSGSTFEARHPETDRGHALIGPVAVRGAEPGDVLAVQVNQITPGKWGWNVAGGFPHAVNERLGIADAGHRTRLNWSIDIDTMTGTNQFGHQVALQPFMGMMGLAPAEPGIHSTVPPRFCGGNIDCKELIAGSTLYLPVATEGALFSTGDGHAAQGDGEVSVTAIECGMEVVDLTFFLLKGMNLSMPRAKTPSAWITFGFHEDLNEATAMALEEMVKFMVELYPLTRAEALALASVVVDLRVTQIVNQTRGVHAVLPHGAIRGIQKRV